MRGCVCVTKWHVLAVKVEGAWWVYFHPIKCVVERLGVDGQKRAGVWDRTTQLLGWFVYMT